LTPYIIAFLEDGTDNWGITIETIIDFVFLVDLVLNFRFAYVNKMFEVVDDQNKIARHYLKTWFAVDLLAIMPFELIARGFGAAGGVSFSSLGKVPKMFKLVRLFRILKIIKEREKFIQIIKDLVRIEIGYERLIFFILLFVTVLHINACLWVFIGKTAEDYENSWIKKAEQEDMPNAQLYISSFYFVVTTITTVGYGDYSGTNSTEKMFCSLLMICGVLSFSFSTSSLSSIMSTKDQTSAVMLERMRILTEIDEKY